MKQEFSETLTLKSSPEALFAGFTNVEDFTKWMKGCTDVKTLTEGEVGVGTEFEETRVLFGFLKATEHFKVEAYEPPRLITLFIDGTKGSSRKGWFRFTYEFLPEGSGTKLHVTGEIEDGSGGGWLAKKLSTMGMNMCRKSIHTDMESLDRWVRGEV